MPKMFIPPLPHKHLSTLASLMITLPKMLISPFLRCYSHNNNNNRVSLRCLSECVSGHISTFEGMDKMPLNQQQAGEGKAGQCFEYGQGEAMSHEMYYVN